MLCQNCAEQRYLSVLYQDDKCLIKTICRASL